MTTYLGLIPDNPAEWKALASRKMPLPYVETHFAFGLAHAVMTATKLGVFESLAAQAATAPEIIRCCGTDSEATKKLLIALVGNGYLDFHKERFALTPTARTWLLAASPGSVIEAVLFAFEEWDWMSHIEAYVRNGTRIDVHKRMTADQWDLYQRSMRALAGQLAQEVAQTISMPDGAVDMIDVGGSHGHYSAVLCRRNPGLRSVVLDLPEAVKAAAPLLTAERMGDRVVHRAADALTYDFGVGTRDVVLLCNLAHHFSELENADLFKRLGGALRPGGLLAVIEPIRLEAHRRTDQFAALNDLYFGLTSRSGTWTARDIARWQRDAGLDSATEPIILRDGDTCLQVATKT